MAVRWVEPPYLKWKAAAVKTVPAVTDVRWTQSASSRVQRSPFVFQSLFPPQNRNSKPSRQLMSAKVQAEMSSGCAGATMGACFVARDAYCTTRGRLCNRISFGRA